MSGSTEAASRFNFNPDWMAGNVLRQKLPSFSSSSQNEKSANPYYQNANANDSILAPPKLAKNRYGREELLALFTESNMAPTRLKDDFVDFFIEKCRAPICMQPYSEAEQQLLVQGGINSSKVLSTVNHAQQRFIHSTGTHQPASSIVNSGTSNNSRWGGGNSINVGVSGSGGTGGRGFGRGSGSPSSDNSSYHLRGRGGSTSFGGVGGIGRGNRFGGPPGRSVGGMNENKEPLVKNSRAQGLFDPNNPRDRPRPRLKSTGRSDDVGVESFGSFGHSRVQHSSSANNTGHMPEWATDDIDEDSSPKTKTTGSFDATGNFRQEDDRSSSEKHVGKSRDETNVTPADVVAVAVAATLAAEKRRALPLATVTSSSLLVNNVTATSPEPRRQPQTFAATAAVDSAAYAKFLTAPKSSSEMMPKAAATAPTKISESPFIKLPTASAKTPNSSTGAKKSDEDVLSNLHLQAESLVHSVFLEDNDTASMVTALSTVSNTGVTPNAGSVSGVVPEEWFYVDPSEKCQGPFSSVMMSMWFTAGYFTQDLRIKSNKDMSYSTLGDLIKKQGGIPFNTPNVTPAATVPSYHAAAPTTVGVLAANFLTPSFVKPTATFQTAPQQMNNNAMLAAGAGGVVDPNRNAVANVTGGFATATPSNSSNGLNSSGQPKVWDVYNCSNVSTNVLGSPLNSSNMVQNYVNKPLSTSNDEAEQNFTVLLARLKLEEAMRQQLEENKKLIQREEDMKRSQEEMKHQFEQEQKRLRDLQLQVEKENVEKEKEAKMRREFEATKIEQQRRLMEEKERAAEFERRKVVEAKLREEQERQRQEQARIQQEYLREEENLRKLREEKDLESREVQRLEEKRRRILQQREQVMVSGGSVWSSPAVVTKIFPQTTETNSSAARSLREIQLEEERQMASDRRQQLEHELGRKEVQVASAVPVTGAWNSSNAKGLKWESLPSAIQQNAASMPTKNKQTTAAKSVWQVSNTFSSAPNSDTTNCDVAEGFWDDEPQTKDDKRSKKPVMFVNSTHTRSQPAAGTKNKNNKQSTTDQIVNTNADHVRRHLVASANTIDEFSAWCVKQVKKLNKDIDESEAAVFIEFLKNVPDIEVTDYVLNYIPESVASKEFLKEFIERRKRAKFNNGAPLTNEWLVVNKQNNQNNHGSDSVNDSVQQSGRKRNKKGAHVKVDSSILGFKPAGDPNRVNVGEIDSPM